MIIYFENSDNFNIQCENTIKEIDFHIKSQNSKLKILLDFMVLLICKIDTMDDSKNTEDKFNQLNNLKLLVNTIKNNLTILVTIKNELTNILKENNASNSFTDEIKEKIKNYNQTVTGFIDNLYSSHTESDIFIQNYITSTISSSQKFLADYTLSKAGNKNEIVNEDNKSLGIIDNPVLLISEKEGKVFLPYTVSELEAKLKNNHKYKTLQQIIDFEYVLPISRYKSPILARFKEAYSLMKNKEDASILDCLDLSIELAFNYSLHPAIITACKSLDELDLYLDCLDSNKLYKFDIFEVKFDVLPMNTKK